MEGWGRKEDAVSSEVTTCCTQCACLGWQPWMTAPGELLSPQAMPPARLTDMRWPLQVIQNTPQCLVQNLAQSHVLWKDFFFSLNKENPACKGDKTSHSVQIWGCFHGFQQTHCSSVLLIKVLMFLEDEWLFYLNATYTWVLIKKDVLNQFYHNTIFPSFPQPDVYLHKVCER